MTNQIEASGRSGLGRPIDTVVKVLPLVAISLYALGLVVVNAYLSLYGAADFSLLKPQLIYTGVLVLVPLFVCAISQSGREGLIWLKEWADRMKETLLARNEQVEARPGETISRVNLVSRAGPFVQWISSLAERMEARASKAMSRVILLLPAGLFFIWFIGLGQRGDEALPHALDLYVTAAILVWLVRKALAYLARGPSTQRDRAYGMLMLLLLVVASAAYLAKFIDDVYRNVPEQYGGQRPFVVQLLLKPDSTAGLERLGLPIPDDRGVSSPVTVVFEGSDFYLLNTAGLSVRIDKDLVEATKLPPPHLP
jgi:hypothetical protein